MTKHVRNQSFSLEVRLFGKKFIKHHQSSTKSSSIRVTSRNPGRNCTAATKEALPRTQIFTSNRVASRKMLRTALLRTAAAAVAAQPVLRTSVRRLAARSNIISYAPRPSTSIIPRAAAWTTVRSYSSGGGSLTKDDVTNRIMELLKGFDKVRDSSTHFMISASVFALSWPRIALRQATPLRSLWSYSVSFSPIVAPGDFTVDGHSTRTGNSGADFVIVCLG